MSRRSIGSAALVAVLLSGFPMLGAAHANTCASWTDPKDDATTNSMGQEPLRDPNMDIVSTSVSTIGTSIVATIKVQDLVESGYSDTGDMYYAQIKIAGTFVRFVATRSEVSETAALTDTANAAKGAATVTFDPVDNTVAIAATPAELDKAAGKATAGVTATDLSAATTSHVNGNQLMPYDNALAPAAITYTVGAQCTPVVEPVTLAMPEGTCNDFTDIPADGLAVIAGPATAPHEDGLDVVAVAFNSTPQAFYTYVKVAKLGAKPANFQGDRFQVTLKAGTKTFTFAAGRMNVGKSVSAAPTRGQVGTATNAGLKVRGVFDIAKNTVVIVVDRASLDTVNGSAIADGTTVTEVVVKTFGLLPGLESPADTAQATDAAARTYTFGTNKCFPPPPGVLTNAGKTVVQFTDAAAVAATLTNAAGAPLAGKTVTFSIGSKTATATTNAAGLATASLNPGVNAGTGYALVAKFAGDGSASAVTLSTPFSVSQEKTSTTLRVVKSGTKRTVYATLKDDDGKAVAGQVVTWYINGRKASAPRTTSSGVVTLTTAKPTQTVKAVFTTVSGKYLGSSAQAKV